MTTFTDTALTSLQLLTQFDPLLWSIVGRSLWVSVLATVLACSASIAAGARMPSASSVRFTATCGDARQVLKVKLVNPFRPVFSGDSLGIGWGATGHSSAPLRLTKFDGCSQITITTGGPYAQERAIGFRQASLSLGYS